MSDGETVYVGNEIWERDGEEIRARINHEVLDYLLNASPDKEKLIWYPLSDFLGVTLMTLWRWAEGRAHPTVKQSDKLAEFFHINVACLYMKLEDFMSHIDQRPLQVFRVILAVQNIATDNYWTTPVELKRFETIEAAHAYIEEVKDASDCI